MSKFNVTTMDVEGMKVVCIGKPDFSRIPEVKLDRFVDFCMESLDRYYSSKKEVKADKNKP